MKSSAFSLSPGGIDPSYSPRTPAEVIDLFTQAWIEKDLYHW